MCQCSHVTMCTWLCIHLNLAVYPCAEFGFALWATAETLTYVLCATAQNLSRLCGPQRRLSSALWATAQNWALHCGSQSRIKLCVVATAQIWLSTLSHGTESLTIVHRITWTSFKNLLHTSYGLWGKKCTCIYCTTQALYRPCLKSMLETGTQVGSSDEKNIW